MIFPTSLTLLSTLAALASAQVTCNVGEGAGQGSAEKCIAYLQGLGSRGCVVDSNAGGQYPVKFCGEDGDAYVYGSVQGGVQTASSSCSDVAAAVQDIFNQCNPNPQGGVSGTSPAHGNGNLLVSLHG